MTGRPWWAEAHAAGVKRLSEVELDGESMYCGCEDCIVREVLDATWQIIAEGAKTDVDPLGGDATISALQRPDQHP